MKKLLILILTFAIFLSCKKKQTESPKNQEPLAVHKADTFYLVSQIDRYVDTSFINSTVVTYNDGGHITRLEERNQFGVMTDSNGYTNYEYSNNGLLFKETSFNRYENSGPIRAGEPRSGLESKEYYYQNTLLTEVKYYDENIRNSQTTRILTDTRKYVYSADKYYEVGNYDSIIYAPINSLRPQLIEYFTKYRLNGELKYKKTASFKNTYDENWNKIKVEIADSSNNFKPYIESSFDLNTKSIISDYNLLKLVTNENLRKQDFHVENESRITSDYDCGGEFVTVPVQSVLKRELVKDKKGNVIEIKTKFNTNCPGNRTETLKIKYKIETL
ncbi:MAG: hypothetical protein H7329_12225 [Opitutaceae bacterium]|nr:hypothetical protein [Cytophagales bacterium]